MAWSTPAIRIWRRMISRIGISPIGISGFGKSGKLHSSSLLDMSLDLPLVMEFFDVPHKVDSILEHIRKDIEPGHIVSWPATLVV